ncbi:MAG: D-glycero-beta-D-manno-heptose-7-phosphate kinase [Candidatus Gygaella obscura]|nr:D-glycero-beta-D-manno-heptose-7-phosphate kinase [Candidatus Gygaella obscura]
MNKTRLKSIVSAFSKARIMVVGDIILDEYIWGHVTRISPEAPVPVVQAYKRSFMPGGAANVAYNINTLSGKSSIVGVVGIDKNRDILLSQLKARNIYTKGILSDSKRRTTLKSRIIAKHQQMVRVDWENIDTVSSTVVSKIMDFIKKNINKFDAVIIEDYGKGVINEQLLSNLIPFVRSKGKIITVDPKEEHFRLYKNVSGITPNLSEAENAIRNLKIKDTENRFNIHFDKIFNLQELNLAAKKIIDYLGLDSLLVTLGENGMRLFEKNNKKTHISTLAQEVFDVSGAGDTVISAFTLSLACGASFLDAAKIANIAAGIVVGKVGTAEVTKEELLRKIKDL